MILITGVCELAEFKVRLRMLRESKGMTQEDLAKALNISRSRLASYEQGQREPGFELLEEIADFFNVDMNYILGKEDSHSQIEGMNLDELMEHIHKTPEYKMLLSKSRKLDKEKLLLLIQMIDSMK
jgi:transcriptional regulator with XRE-family HTH domain